jgi:TolB-like protein/Tfp pilus assembly protein PilF
MSTEPDPRSPPGAAGRLRIGRRRWLIAAALVLAVGAAAWWTPQLAELARWVRAGGASGAVRSLAVLPFDNLSGDPGQLYLVDGMQEALITDLAKIGALKVISRASAMRYRDTDKPLDQIGRELGVDALVEGSVLRVGDRVRVTAELVHASSGTDLWADSYEGDLTDVLRLQSDTARAIARQIEIAVTAEDEARLRSDEQVDRVAFEELLKGRHHLNQRTRDEIFLSLEYFRRSIEADPSFYLSQVAWVEASILTGWYRWVAPGEAFPAAKRATERALELAPGSAEAHTMAAAIAMLWDWDYVTAEREYLRAIELNPGYPRAHHWYALFLSYMARYDEAVTEIRRARELDPLSTIIRAIEALCYCQAQRYEEAIETAWQALEMTPDFPLALSMVNCGYLGLGRYEQAIAEARLAYEVTRGSGELADLIEANYLAGHRDEALELLAELEVLAGREHVAPTTMASTYLVFGRHQQALDWLEEAYEQHSWSLLFLRRRIYDPLRSEPRFRDLYRRVGLDSAMIPPRAGPQIERESVAGESGSMEAN